MGRSFRRGLRLGLFAGAVVAAVKLAQSRRRPAVVETPEPWARPAPLFEETTPATTEIDVSAALQRERASEPPPASLYDRELDMEPPLTETAATSPEHELAETPTPPAPSPSSRPGRKPAKRAPATKKAGPATKAAKKAAGPTRAWVEPSGGTCPPTHPVKGKLSSKLYHLPGMLAYARTRPDRCYRDEQAAGDDGLTRARR